MAEDPYKSSTPQERFARQLDRDLLRGPSGTRLSQSTLRRLITDDTAQWARAIYAEKRAVADAINVQKTQNQSGQTSSSVVEFQGQAFGDASSTPSQSVGSQPQALASTSETTFPDGKNNGDILYWNGAEWSVLGAPQSSVMHVLTITQGGLSWVQTINC